MIITDSHNSILSVFGDESADETKERVFAVAGVIGSEAQWQKLEAQWVERSKGRVFHANHCDSDQGEYRNTPHRENKELYKDLTQLLAVSEMGGFGFAIDLKGQKEVFPNAPDISYYKCLTEVMDAMTRCAVFNKCSVKFTFDQHPETEYNTGVIFRTLTDFPVLGKHLFPNASFDSRRNPRIQVADLFARETMKALDNVVGPVKRPPRKSLTALTDTQRFHVLAVQRDYFEDMKRKMPEAQKITGMEEHKYHQWLKDNNRQHNITNMFLFIEHLGKLDKA